MRQYYPGQEVINEHNDPNLAETPHYKEKQTILPHPLSAEQHAEKKLQTPVKRTHDGKVKKEKKDPYKSPMINDEQSSPKEACIKADEAKIDMRKMIIEHKSHKKRSSTADTSKSAHPPSSTSSSSSSSGHSKKEKSKHKSHSSDSHRSHSSKKSSSSHSSDKHGRNENRKSSSSSSNHSSQPSEKHKTSSEISSKKVETSKTQSNKSQPAAADVSVPPQNEEVAKQCELIKAASPIQVSSTHSNAPVSPPSAPVAQNESESQSHHLMSSDELIQFDVLPPLPPLPEMPIEIPPPPPPPPLPILNPIDEEKPQPINKSSTSPDSSTQQTLSSPALKIRKVSNAEKTAASTDLLGSIMASMDSPRNASSN